MKPETMKAVREAIEAERKAWRASGMAGVPLKELRERMEETDRLLDTEASQQDRNAKLVEALEKIEKAELWSSGHHVRLDATTIQAVPVFAAATLAAHKKVDG